MKVLEEVMRGVSRGARVDLEALGLPASGTRGLLIVFWKEK
jgi:hypothetical protein